MPAHSLRVLANFFSFEVEEEVLPNLREYALANSLYWALSEGHACEISARRNAMDVSCPIDFHVLPLLSLGALDLTVPTATERLQERR